MAVQGDAVPHLWTPILEGLDGFRDQGIYGQEEFIRRLLQADDMAIVCFEGRGDFTLKEVNRHAAEGRCAQVKVK